MTKKPIVVLFATSVATSAVAIVPAAHAQSATQAGDPAAAEALFRAAVAAEQAGTGRLPAQSFSRA